MPELFHPEIEWARLKAHELRELAGRGAVVVIPVAAMEQHGPHLPVQVDSRLATEVSQRAARDGRERAWLFREQKGKEQGRAFDVVTSSKRFVAHRRAFVVHSLRGLGRRDVVAVRPGDSGDSTYEARTFLAGRPRDHDGPPPDRSGTGSAGGRERRLANGHRAA